MVKYIFTLAFFCVVSRLAGQQIVPTPEDMYNDAIEFIYSGDYPDALSLLHTLHERGFTSANINYLIGECYLNMQGQKHKAIPFLKASIEKISEIYKGNSLDEEYAPKKALLYLGIAYRLNYDFDNALLYLNNYLKSFNDSDKDNIYLAEYHIERCNYARELISSPAKFKTDTLPSTINNSVSNFNALITSDEKLLFFENKFKFYDAVMNTVKKDSGWDNPENLTPLIKSDGDHYITGISAHGDLLYLTAYDPYNSGEIFSTRIVNGKWEDMQKLNSNINTIYNETHASESADGRILYFTSDRKGGYGGLDIYRSVKDANGEWGNAINLGPLINTQYNEETPFLSSNGKKLFFSSQGHYNMGGYDIFYCSAASDGNWLPPVNIGYPLNGTDDDMFFFPLDSGKIAYQARYVNNSAETDIYKFTIFEFGKPKRFIVNGKIDLQAENNFDPGNISVTFIDKNVNDTVAKNNLNSDGSFRQNLSSGDYRLDFKDNAQTLLSKDLYIPDYLLHNNLVFNEKIIIPKVISFDTLYLKDIRFGFNLSEVKENYYLSLDEIIKIMNKYPEIKLQINGYTDALGSSDYNLRLSVQRANKVKDYLESLLKSGNRVFVKGFGETNPVAINVKSDGSDSPEGRSFNRRTEISVLDAPESLKIIRVKEVPETLLLK